MSLLDEVAGLLTGRGIDVALIGAAALAAHEVSRATADLDLLLVDLAVLDDEIWSDLRAAGDEVEVRRGDEADPVVCQNSADPKLDLGLFQAGIVGIVGRAPRRNSFFAKTWSSDCSANGRRCEGPDP